MAALAGTNEVKDQSPKASRLRTGENVLCGPDSSCPQSGAAKCGLRLAAGEWQSGLGHVHPGDFKGSIQLRALSSSRNK